MNAQLQLTTKEQTCLVIQYAKQRGLLVTKLEMNNETGVLTITGERVARQSFGDEPYKCQKPWPMDCGVQCGGDGMVVTGGAKIDEALSDPKVAAAVIGGKTPHYRTAFFEAFPASPKCFIRGEGATIQEAEQNAWKQHQKILACPKHEFEARGRRDGYGHCKHCGLGQPDVLECLNKCVHCGAATNWAQDADGNYWCEAHSELIPDEKLSTMMRLLRERREHARAKS